MQCTFFLLLMKCRQINYLKGEKVAVVLPPAYAGSVAERLNATVLKTVEGETLP